MEAKDKREWMLGLQVGDVVCDCRFLHLRIKKIDDCQSVVIPRAIRNLVLNDRLPMVLSDALYDAAYHACRILGRVEVVDRDLILEDGASCSALHCCDDAEHTWKHPESK